MEGAVGKFLLFLGGTGWKEGGGFGGRRWDWLEWLSDWLIGS